MIGTDAARAGDPFEDGRPDHAAGLSAVAERHGVSLEAVRHLLRALERGHGTSAQFDHPDLGGMGQWFSGGMTMVGRMFDDALRARVAALCAELAQSLPAGGFAEAGRGAGAWWPADLGRPASTGAQDGMRYAHFPDRRRIAVESAGAVSVYDTGEDAVTGVSQSNGALSLTGARGAVALGRLRRIEAEVAAPRQADPARAPAPPPAAGGGVPGAHAMDVLGVIERLADLHARGILTEREFADKKAELLARL